MNWRDLLTNYMFPSLQDSNNHLLTKFQQSMWKKNAPILGIFEIFKILGNALSLVQNLRNVEWKTLSISKSDQDKLYGV